MKRKSPHSQDAWSEGSDSFLHWCTFFILCRLDQLSAFVGKTPRSNTVLQLLETLCGFPRPLAAVTGISWSTRGNLPASWPHLFLIKINFVLGRERNKTLSIVDIMAQCFGQQSCRERISGPQASDGVRSSGISCCHRHMHAVMFVRRDVQVHVDVVPQSSHPERQEPKFHSPGKSHALWLLGPSQGLVLGAWLGWHLFHEWCYKRFVVITYVSICSWASQSYQFIAMCHFWTKNCWFDSE